MNIAELLTEQARTRPGAAAIIDRGGAMSFAELEDRSARAATVLERRGLEPGDAVLFFRPMSRELYVALLAAFRLGLVPMALDPSAGRAHIERCCEMRAPRALVATAKAHLLRLVSPALRAIPHNFVRLEGGSAPPRRAVVPRENADPALLTFTSGSTGRPKAAVRTHGFLLAQLEVLRRSLKLEPGQSDLTTLPVFTLANLACGVTSVIPDADLRRPAEIWPQPVLRQMEAQAVQSIAASPAFLSRLAGSGRQVAGLRKVFVGGGPVFPALLEKLRWFAPQAEVVAVYGSTEAEPIAEVAREAIGPEDLEAMQAGAGLLAGSPVRQISLRILPDRWGTPLASYTAAAFDADCLAPNQTGEIVVSGSHVLGGYLNGEGDLETKFEVDGRRWHRTGDSGYLDGRGRLWLAGRASAKVADDRGVLYPFAIECAASWCPEVARLALVGWRGRRVLAVEWTRRCQPDAGALSKRLAWAQIDEVVSLRRIPMDGRHNSKVDYPRLLQALGTALGK